MKCSLGISNFLEEVSIPSYSLFSTIPLDWSFKKSFLSLLAILCNSAFKWVYLSFSPLFFASLLFTGISKASSEQPFYFFAFLFLGDGLDSCLLYNVMNLCYIFNGVKMRSGWENRIWD